MTTTTFPQELIQQIIDQVEDKLALKACSLACPSFREPSQRILLHSLKLDVYQATVTCYCVALSLDDDAGDLPTYGARIRSKLTPLLLSDKSETICRALSSPQFAPYIAALRKLKLLPHHPISSVVISSVAGTLEHLRFDCSLLIPLGALSPLPPLPVLRLIDLVLPSIDFKPGWLIENPPTILTSSPPSLGEIRVTYFIGFRPSRRLLYPKPETLQTIDMVMTSSYSSPRLRWRLEFKREEHEQPDEHEQHMLEMEKVFIQRHSFADDLREWPVR
ncbi:hypothetical protein B0H19DRAFT_1271314 [Mycena capillaripes]|nr:hypothetical protein B0H19DRAFT_1271314 [Mycena capillaripes]